MELAFYNASVAASQQQKSLDVTAGNVSNINTDGYRSQKATFADMLYCNIHAQQGTDTDLTVGSGARVEKTDINFSQGLAVETGEKYDYAIEGNGFFAVYNVGEKQLYYTRKGNFSLGTYGNSNTFFLVTDNGEFVLDANGQMIQADPGDENRQQGIGIYDFDNYQGMTACGNGLYQPDDRNGRPFINTDAVLHQGSLEKSNSDLSVEMTDVIKAQRSYQAQLRMITTSDEITQTINNLRG